VSRPVLPLGRRPWVVLLAVSLALALFGLASGSGDSLFAGSLGLAATFVAFVLPRLIAGHEPPGDDDYGD